MKNISIIFNRELVSYFSTPIAYVFLVIFLLLAGSFTFYMGNFYERGQADLLPFFGFHPWRDAHKHRNSTVKSIRPPSVTLNNRRTCDVF